MTDLRTVLVLVGVLLLSVTKLYPTLQNPMDCSMPGFPVLHHLLEFAQVRVHRIGDTIQPPHPLLLVGVSLSYCIAMSI